ncbi:MAG: RluA family pseudouridine synthase [Candidatus Sumerlaeaceae bacterium]|nr:RluA family pseudouridine synthase [Candidatus Sumerlaeaceae bacterium]
MNGISSGTCTLQNQEIKLEVAAADAGQRLDVYLTRKLPWLSRNRIQSLIEEGAVKTSLSLSPRAKDKVEKGLMVIVAIPPPKPATPVPQQIPLEILYEDEDLLVINKPAGLPVHPGAGNPDGTLVNALLALLGGLSTVGGVERPGILHRLDKDTTGVMIVAKNDVVHNRLSEALMRREIHRRYWAIVLREPRDNLGVINAPIARHPANRTKMAVVRQGGRHAVTHYRVLERFHGFTLVECELETGRTHQIRVHMASMGHPVLGDPCYGGELTKALRLVPPRNRPLIDALSQVTRQMLHAREISFVHPRSHVEMRFEAPLPADFTTILDALRSYGRLV